MQAMIRAAVLVGVAMVSAVGASRGAEPVALDAVPSAVIQAVKGKFPGAEIKKAEKNVKVGETTYEYSVGLVYNGFGTKVRTSAAGAVQQVEKKISLLQLKEVPSAAMDSVLAKFPKAYFRGAKEITVGPKVTYGFSLMLEGKPKFSVVVSPSGEILQDGPLAAK